MELDSPEINFDYFLQRKIREESLRLKSLYRYTLIHFVLFPKLYNNDKGFDICR